MPGTGWRRPDRNNGVVEVDARGKWRIYREEVGEVDDTKKAEQLQ